MSEINQTTTKRQRRGVVKTQKLSTRVDLTPMVDLGFLLITFFIFTTSIAKPTSMHLAMPNDGDATNIASSKTLTLVLGDHNKLFYYMGSFHNSLIETGYESNKIRTLIVQQKRFIKDHFNTNDQVVLIKATSKASYKNIVDCLDEMLINTVPTYMLLDATSQEQTASGINYIEVLQCL